MSSEFENVRLIMIPAHMESSRLPGKPLLYANGKPLVQYVYEAAKQVPNAVVIVTTDSAEIIYTVREFDGLAVYAKDCLTGTHRVAKSLECLGPDTYRYVPSVVSWQVDEPLVDPKWVSRLFDLLEATPSVQIATLVAPLAVSDEYNPCVVKTVTTTGRCEWFSRNYINKSKAHVGIYAYRTETLLDLGKLEPTIMSTQVGLEQLAWLEAGYSIHSIDVDHSPLAINSQADWNQFLELMEKN